MRLNSVFYVKALVGTFNQEKALVGAFSVIVKHLRQSSFQALVSSVTPGKVSCGHLLLGPGAQELLAHVVVAGLYCAEERDAAAGVLLQSEVIRRVEQQHLHYLQHGNHVNITFIAGD